MPTVKKTVEAPPEEDLVTKEINLLHRISQALGYDLSLTDVLNLIVNITADLMGSKIVSILLSDEGKGELNIAATQSLSQDYRDKPRVKLNHSISGQAVLTKQPQVCEDVRESQDFGFKDLAKKEGIVSLLCVPMVVKGHVIGVINSYSPVLHHYTDKEVKILSLVAGQAAIAIENARLQVATQATQKDLESRKLVDQAKAILIKEKGMSEPVAFRHIQKQSMNTRTPMRDIAKAIILSSSGKGD